MENGPKTIINEQERRIRIQERLNTLGIRTPLDRVTTAVQLLAQGHTPYSLYRGSRRTVPLVSKGTAIKLARFFKEGKLGFIAAEARASRIIAKAWPLDETETEAQVRERDLDHEMVEERAEYEAGSDLCLEKQRLREGAKNDPDRFLRYNVVNECPHVEWNIASLESVGIPADKALALLAEYDELDIWRTRAGIGTVTWDQSGKAVEGKSYMWKFPGLERYVALHYLVDYSVKSRGRGAPYSVLDQAATLHAKGLLSCDNRLEAAGEDIIRYEVWRGKDYLEAYFKAQERFQPTKKRREKFRAEIESKTAVMEGSQSDTIVGKSI